MKDETRFEVVLRAGEGLFACVLLGITFSYATPWLWWEDVGYLVALVAVCTYVNWCRKDDDGEQQLVAL